VILIILESSKKFYLSTNKAILFLAGCNSILLQYLLLKELPASIFSTEITVLLALTSYFLGFSVGYFLVGKLSLNKIKLIIILLFPVHTFLIFIIRVLAFLFFQIREVWLFLSFFTSLFIFCSFYSIFLPLFLLKVKRKKIQGFVSTLYSLELMGSIFGSLLILLSQFFFPYSIYFIYVLIFYSLMLFLLRNKVVFSFLAITFITLVFIFPYLNKTTLELFYSKSYAEHLNLIDSIYSPYNRIDVLEDEKNHRYLSLDGIFYFGTKDLEDFNLYLAEIPLYVKKNVSDVLIVGGGTLSSAFHASKYASNITVVELDPGVILTASNHFKEFNHLDKIADKINIVVDDGKHYLMNSNRKFDVIIVDVPYPWNIQTTLLYTIDFYGIVKTKLKEDGILVTHLSGSMYGNEINTKIPKRIAKSVSEVFPNYITYSFENLGYEIMIASSDFKISRDMIYNTVNKLRIGRKTSTLEKEEIDKITNSSNPITLFNLDVVITESMLMIK